MSPLERNRAIKADYEVKCDITTNTNDIVNANGMLALIRWSGVKSTERIKVISTLVDETSTILFEVEQ
jgi:hypothetical protein